MAQLQLVYHGPLTNRYLLGVASQLAIYFHYCVFHGFTPGKFSKDFPACPSLQISSPSCTWTKAWHPKDTTRNHHSMDEHVMEPDRMLMLILQGPSFKTGSIPIIISRMVKNSGKCMTISEANSRFGIIHLSNPH